MAIERGSKELNGKANATLLPASNAVVTKIFQGFCTIISPIFGRLN